EANALARKAMDKIREIDHDQIGMRLLEDSANQKKIWKIREAGVGASRVPGVEDSWPSWEDAAVAPENVGKYLRDFYKLLDKYHYVCTLYGHFGDGCIHARITFNPKTAEGVRNYRGFMTEIAHIVVRHGGSLSGEHGDGQARAELLPIMFGSDLIQAFREFKSAWDPLWRMNPGKIVDPYPLDSNLREGPDYKPKPVLTWCQFPDDNGSLAQATERCFGVGKCRGVDGGTMCPSFHATRDEMHTTRGRARLLFEMLRGDVIQDGWRDEHIREALDLCLACKGCKGDCPVNVDVATYKAEFLAHYYQGRLRPVAAYSMGLIHAWARLAALAPGLVNALAQSPLTATLVKRLGGIAPERQIPPFSRRTFKQMWRSRPPRHPEGQPVLLWPDTFNDHFFPETALAAAEAL